MPPCLGLCFGLFRFAVAACVLISLQGAPQAQADTHSKPQTGAAPLKLATWNLEHLADTDGEGCKPRGPEDYERLKAYADQLDADIVAVQEVENATALARVFDPKEWHFEISRRPNETPAPECWHRPGANLITQRTGFASARIILFCPTRSTALGRTTRRSCRSRKRSQALK